MWIPTPVYERIPQFWLLLGLLFMSCGTFLGFSFNLTFVYFAIGFICCMRSMWVFTMRLNARVAPQQTEAHPESAGSSHQPEQLVTD